MRVGLVVAGDVGATSGGFYYDRRLLDRLRDRGHEPSVVALDRRHYARHLLDNLRRLERRLSEFDVVVEDGLAHPSLIAANRRLESPVVALSHMVWTERASGVRRRVVRAVERRYFSSIDAAIYNSEATRRAAERLVPDGSASDFDAVVVPPGGDRFDPAAADGGIRERAVEGPLSVVFLGNVVRRKGLDTLVDGLARVDADWRLSVVGDRTVEPGYAARVERQVARAGLSDRVRFEGRLEDSEVADRLAGAHVLAVPSRYEPFGIVYLEGMSFGCVPLATTNGGAPEFVDDGVSGVLVDPDDPRAIAARLERLAANRDRLADVGVGARREYERRPTWGESLDRAVDFLEDACRTT